MGNSVTHCSSCNTSDKEVKIKCTNLLKNTCNKTFHERCITSKLAHRSYHNFSKENWFNQGWLCDECLLKQYNIETDIPGQANVLGLSISKLLKDNEVIKFQLNILRHTVDELKEAMKHKN